MTESTRVTPRFVFYTPTKRVVIQAESIREAEAQFQERYGYLPARDQIEQANDD